MATVLLATDSDSVHADVASALGGDNTMVRVRSGVEVLGAVQEHEPELVVLDLQIGNQGGMATCLDLRLEERAGRIDPLRVMMLLDRDADEFLAKRAEADGWIVKPLNPFSIRKAAAAALAESDADTED